MFTYSLLQFKAHASTRVAGKLEPWRCHDRALFLIFLRALSFCTTSSWANVQGNQMSNWRVGNMSCWRWVWPSDSSRERHDSSHSEGDVCWVRCPGQNLSIIKTTAGFWMSIQDDEYQWKGWVFWDTSPTLGNNPRPLGNPSPLHSHIARSKCTHWSSNRVIEIQEQSSKSSIHTLRLSSYYFLGCVSLTSFVVSLESQCVNFHVSQVSRLTVHFLLRWLYCTGLELRDV